MKTFADIKRQLNEGAKLKLIRHDWLKPNMPLKIGAVRKIIKRQSNAIQFEGGSWLTFPKASDVLINEKGFSIVLSVENAQFMEYEILESDL
jgi:ribosomal protein L14